MADPATYRPKTADIPTDPGVYRFSDAQGAVIYLGKAKNLRSRLTSYFGRMSGLHERTQRMVKTACQVQWTVVHNELEALQLEYTWIKQFDPRFNVKYRDDKSYPWLAVTTSEEFPRVFVGRGAKKRGNRYFGPYGQAWAIRETVDMLLRVFPMRSCSAGTFRNAASSGRACLLGYIDKCSAPCIGRVTPEEHRQIVDDFCSFMGGQSQTIIRRTEAQMKTAAAALDFENAARLRDDLGALRKASERNSIVLGDGTDADVIALIEDPLEVAIQIFHVRKGRVSGERGWVADRVDDSDLASLMEKFLVQLYADVDDSEIPREILVSTLPESAASLEELLAEASGRKVSLRVPQRGDKKNLLETVSRNAAQALIQHKTKRASDLTTRNRALEEIQKALDLPDAPLRIECYDISHTQGTEVVASMVVFEDGLPRKSEYRRFIIRTVEGSDDVGSMREVLLRRFKRWLDDKQVVAEDPEANFDATIGAPRRFAYAPSLVVVDGGLPQVNAAAAVFEELGITDVGLCGLAKRLEELWLPGEEYPTILPRSSEGLYLLQRLRDEAHRFAISHHRGRRSKAMLESELDNIPGLGDTRRKALLQAFGSLKKLRAATVEELQQVPGVGPTLAANVWAALQQGDAPSPIDMSTGELLSDGQ